MRLHNWLAALPPAAFVAVMVAATIVAKAAVAPAALYLDRFTEHAGEPQSHVPLSIGMVVLVLLVAPILETLIFQVGAIGLLRRVPFLRERVVMCALLAGSAFGMAHFSSPSRILLMGAGGCVLAYAYLLKSPPVRRGFVLVATVHCCHNLIMMALPDA